MTDHANASSHDTPLGVFSFNDHGESGWSALPTNEPHAKWAENRRIARRARREWAAAADGGE